MKFLIILAVIGFVVCPPTKEELLKRAIDLEAKLEVDIAKVRSTHPAEARLLEVEEGELKLVSNELRNAHLPSVVGLLEIRLSGIERRVEETLRRIEGRTGAPSQTTIASTKRPTSASTPLPSRATKPETTTIKVTSTISAQTLTAATTRSSTSIPVTDKKKLIETAKQLESDAEKEIKILTDKGNNFNAYELKAEMSNLQDLISQLEATDETNISQLKRIEQEVILAENELKELINKYKAQTSAY